MKLKDMNTMQNKLYFVVAGSILLQNTAVSLLSFFTSLHYVIWKSAEYIQLLYGLRFIGRREITTSRGYKVGEATFHHQPLLRFKL